MKGITRRKGNGYSFSIALDKDTVEFGLDNCCTNHVCFEKNRETSLLIEDTFCFSLLRSNLSSIFTSILPNWQKIDDENKKIDSIKRIQESNR